MLRDMPAATPEQLQVELVDGLIVARLRGEPSAELLEACQNEVLRLLGGATAGKVLYDARDMLPPSVDVPWAQRALDERSTDLRLRRAIVVPSSRLAFLARLAFGEGDYRVFYDDMDAAVSWLEAAAGR